MFKKAELAKIKKELLKRKEVLEEALQNLSSEKVSDTQSQDDGDQVVTITMESLRSALQDTEYQEYNRIVEALAALENGTYGVCIECSQDISEKRLKYYPNARRCLACQEQFEEMNRPF